MKEKENNIYFNRENSQQAFAGEWSAAQYVNSLIKKRTMPSTETLVKEINKRVLFPVLKPEMKDRYAGVYRSLDIMGVIGSGLSIPSWMKVPELMEKYGNEMDRRLKEIKRGTVGARELINHMGYSHYELLKIHPFVDGNGRSARHVLNVVSKLACCRPLVIAPVHRKNYFDALEKVNITRDIRHLNTFLAERWLGSYSPDNVQDKGFIRDLKTYILSSVSH